MTQIYSFATIYGYGLINLSNYIKEKLNNYNLIGVKKNKYYRLYDDSNVQYVEEADTSCC